MPVLPLIIDVIIDPDNQSPVSTQTRVLIYENNISSVEKKMWAGKEYSEVHMNSGDVYLCVIPFKEWENDAHKRKS